MTGQLTNCAPLIKSFFFDCADPSVNFTDGTYYTNLVLKNKSYLGAPYVAGLKIYQDVSAYPNTIELDMGYGSTSFFGGTPLAFPFTNVVGGFEFSMFNAGPYNVTNPLNEQIWVTLAGVTGSGITALSFSVVVFINEFEV